MSAGKLHRQDHSCCFYDFKLYIENQHHCLKGSQDVSYVGFPQAMFQAYVSWKGEMHQTRTERLATIYLLQASESFTARLEINHINCLQNPKGIPEANEQIKHLADCTLYFFLLNRKWFH